MVGTRMVAAGAAMGLLVSACGMAADDDTEVATLSAETAQRSTGPAAVADVEQADEAAADAEVAFGTEPGEAPDEVTFADHGVAGFVDAADLAVSTFQTDADVASFRLTQAWLERTGILPPAAAIRAEEWVNAIDHRYPDPDPDATFRVVADAGTPWWHAPAGAPQDTTLLRIGVQAARDVARPSVSITLVIDTSGSMSTDDRLGTVVEAAGRLLDRLAAGDQVGVVEFNDQARVVIEPTTDHGAVRDALGRLEPGGSTNTGAGVMLGHQQAVAAHRDGDNSAVVLFADGVANRGITDPDGILAEIDTAGSGIVMHTVGVGLEVYNDALLERLANASSGTYAYVDLPEHAEQLFDRDLPVLAPVAHDVKAQVEFDPSVVTAWRLVGYENRLIAADDFRDDAVSGGYVGAGHAVTALYELVLDRESGSPAEGLGTVTVRWAVPRSDQVEETVADLPAELVDQEPTSETFATAAAMGALGEALRTSPHAAVNLDQVANRLEATGDDQDRWLAGIVRTAAAAVQVASPDRQQIDPPGIRVEDRTP